MVDNNDLIKKMMREHIQEVKSFFKKGFYLDLTEFNNLNDIIEREDICNDTTTFNEMLFHILNHIIE